MFNRNNNWGKEEVVRSQSSSVSVVVITKFFVYI